MNTNTFVDALGEPYFQRALVAVVLLGVAGGVAGTHLVLRRLSFYAVALSHATFPAVVIGGMAGASIFVSGVLGILPVAAAITFFGRLRTTGHANATAVVLGAAFALGIFLVTMFPDSVDPAQALVGSLVAISAQDLVVMGVLTTTAVVGLILFHKELVMGAFDPEGSKSVGYKTTMLDLFVLLLIGLVVAASLAASGSLLGISLLVAPALCARAFTKSVRSMLILASAIGAGTGVAGLTVATMTASAPSGVIAVLAALTVVISTGAQRVRQRFKSV